MIESGKAGFILTVISLVVVAYSFAATAWMDVSDDVLTLGFIALATAFAGHFFLGGGEFRKKMIENKRNSRDRK